MRFQLGMTEDHLGHFDAAMEQFQSILKVDPKNSAALNYLGYSWADRGVHLEDAEKMLRQAVALDPDSGAYLDRLGRVRFKRGDPQEASHLLGKAVLLSPDPLIYDHLGDASLADKHPEAALQAWSKALVHGSHRMNSIRKKGTGQEGSAFSILPTPKSMSTYLEGNYEPGAEFKQCFVFQRTAEQARSSCRGKTLF